MNYYMYSNLCHAISIIWRCYIENKMQKKPFTFKIDNGKGFECRLTSFFALSFTRENYVNTCEGSPCSLSSPPRKRNLSLFANEIFQFSEGCESGSRMIITSCARREVLLTDSHATVPR